MRLYSNQLEAHLKNELKPCYLIVGDEPLQIKEATDAVRQKAHSLGFTEREVLHVDAKFSWDNLRASMGTLSLFAEKKLLEVRMPSGKPGAAGSKAISEFVANIPHDICLMIICEEWNAANDKTKWVKSIDSVGVVMRVYLPRPEEFGKWIYHRCQKIGLKIDPQAKPLLSMRLEGNLLAANQELEKLKMRFGNEMVTLQQASQLVSDNSRFDVFRLTDALLMQNTHRVIRMIRSMKQNGLSPVVLHWAIERELRMLLSLAFIKNQGQRISAVDYRRFGIWQQRQAMVQSALNKHSLKQLNFLMKYVAKLDRVIKGQEQGDQWIEIEKWVVLFCQNK